MREFVICLVLILLVGAVVSAHAGAVARTSVTQTEEETLTAQQSEDAGELTDVAGGDAESVLAAVGLIFLVLIVASAIA